MIGPLFLAGSAVGALLTWNAWRPVKPGNVGPLWAPAVATAELAPFHFAWQVPLTAGFVALGGLGGVAGRVALGLTAASWAGLAGLHARARRAASLLTDLGGAAPARLRGWPVPKLPASVERVAGLRYGPHPRHVLDLYRRRDLAPGAPIAVQVHGGSWVRGRRDSQARPLMYHLAEEGWLVASPSYRLSPEATLPDHVVDVKRAIAWLRSAAPELGADPGFVAVTGGSAGGHLAAMVALTGGDPADQPGFEDADTSVQACVPLYGVHALLRADGVTPRWPWLERLVVKRSPTADRDAWRRLSPQHRAHSDAPPFLVLHGTHDSAVRVHVSERFAAALEESGAPVTFVAVPGATHGFDYFNSVRGRATAGAVAGWLARVRAGRWAPHEG